MQTECPQKKSPVGRFLLILLVAFGIIWGIGQCNSSSSSGQPENAAIASRLSYLKTEVAEVVRVEFAGNDVYVSFSGDKLPEDYKIICNAAALNGSEALVKAGKTPTRCSVWVIPAAAAAGDVDKVYYSANARNGKIQ